MRTVLLRVCSVAAVLAASAIATGGCYMMQKSDTYYGVQTAGKKVLFVLDVSGSMEGKSEGSLQDQVTGAAVRRGGEAVGGAVGGALGGVISGAAQEEATKLGAAKRELIPAIQGLNDSNMFTIITFGEKVSPWRDQMIAGSGGNRDQAVIFLKALESNGGTPAKEALERAFAFRDAQIIFFVSDGQPTDGSASDILARVQQLNAGKRVAVHAIGLGDDQDEAFLSALAAQNGGIYVKK